MTDRIISPTAVDVSVFTGANWRDGEDGERGLYVSVAPRGSEGSFVGASVFLATSLDSGECWALQGSISAPATMGFVRGWDLGALPDHFDGDDGTGYGVQVEMLNGELESFASLAEARCSRANLARVGDEILRFQTATLNADGVSYAVSTFDRGLYGTNTGDHVASERFTLLDANTAFVPLTSEMLGRAVYVKVVPTGYSVDEVEAVLVDVPDRPDLIWDNRDVSGLIDGGLDVRTRASVQRFRAVDTGDGLELRWDDVGDPTLSHYEIRDGSQWGGAPVVHRTQATRYVLPRAVTTARTYRIRAYYVGGMFSDTEATVTLTPSVPSSTFEDIATSDVPPEIAGHTNTELDGSDNIIISDGFLSGSYEATQVDASAVGVWDWVVQVDSYQQYLAPVEEWDFPLGSLESHRWTAAGPEPVPGDHGGDTETAVEDYPAPEYWGNEWTTLGRVGAFSDFTQLLVEVRFDTDGASSWTDWEEYEPQRREAASCQVRVTLTRTSEDWQRYVSAIRVEART